MLIINHPPVPLSPPFRRRCLRHRHRLLLLRLLIIIIIIIIISASKRHQ